MKLNFIYVNIPSGLIFLSVCPALPLSFLFLHILFSFIFFSFFPLVFGLAHPSHSYTQSDKTQGTPSSH